MAFKFHFSVMLLLITVCCQSTASSFDRHKAYSPVQPHISFEQPHSVTWEYIHSAIILHHDSSTSDSASSYLDSHHCHHCDGSHSDSNSYLFITATIENVHKRKFYLAIPERHLLFEDAHMSTLLRPPIA